MSYCSKCKTHAINFDSARGENCCYYCGDILDTNLIVSEVIS